MGKSKQKGPSGKSREGTATAPSRRPIPTDIRPERPLQLARDARQRRPGTLANRTISVSPALLLAVGLLLAFLGFVYGVIRPGSTTQPAGQLSPISTVQGQDYHSLAVSPQDPDRVWFGSHSGIQESTDGGRTWRPLPGVSGDAMSLARPAVDANTAYLAGHDIFRRSSDGGRTWQDVQTNLPGTDLHGFAADPQDAGHLFALVVGHGLYESLDRGGTWQLLPAQAPGASGALAVAAGNPPTLYVMSPLGLMRSTDGGKSWHRKDMGLPERGVQALVAVPGQPQKWYAATSDGLYYSSDGGVTWRQVALTGQGLVALAASNSQPLRIYALSREGAVYQLDGAALEGAN